MAPICPECAAGKHQNCDGASGWNDRYDMLNPCYCLDGGHLSIREERFIHLQANLVDAIAIAKTRDRIKDFDIDAPGIISGLLPDVDPENEPGIRGDSFPELTDNELIITHRIKADREVIKDLMDVEVQNPAGQWVPMVPLPIDIFWFVKQCHCGVHRLGIKSYQEHYAYAHILGMED